MHSITNVLYFTFISARSTTWIRIAAELLIGFAASQATLSSQLSTFFLAFLIVGPFFSTAAYILNDITDINLDKKHLSRKDRPITKGNFNINTALLVSIFLFSVSVILGYTISATFMVWVILLGISQSLYTLKPFRFKEKFFFDILINGLSGGMRFILGYLVGKSELTSLPLLLLLFAICLKVILFIGHRLQNRDLERKSNFKSTIASLTVAQIKILLTVLILLAGFLYITSMIYYQWSYLSIVPIILLTLFLVPFIMVVGKGYLLTQEKTLFWRVYLYIALLMFSLSFYSVLR